MAKVYVSSTFLDLKDCRARVNLALRKVGHEDVAMEYYVAGDKRPVEKCLADVAACDLYVGLFAWRYGHVPPADNPEGYSITEMEYRQAQKLGKSCLIFLLSEDALWPRKLMDKDATQIERLRSVLSERHLAGSFTSAEDITEAVYPAVYKWSEEHGQLPRGVSIPELDLAAYVSALTRRYQHLDLDALTPPQRDENLRQRLREVFVEQNVRENPPPVELPKEVWEKLQRDREFQPEDLPTGITPEDVLRARESYFKNPPRPVLDALTDPAHRCSVVLGDPGSGKSTLARYVLLSLVGVEGDEKLRRVFEGHLPLLVELRSYAGLYSKVKDSSFLDFIKFISESEGWGLDRKALEHYLKMDGRAVVVFDGLDEIFDPEERESVALRIAGFAALHPKARVLVTSRVIGYKRKVLTDAEFSHFTLQDLDGPQVEQFIDRWYALALDERPEEALARRERIMRSFDESTSIRQLAGNPMLLTIMAIIGKNQELPRERWKLYDHAAGVLIYHWDVERHLRDRSIDAPFIGEEEKKELLRRLAFKMQSGAGGLAGNYIHRDDLQHEFESYLRDRFAQPPDKATAIARAMIDQFRERNFILSLYGANLYGFVHRAFLEFFCASVFVQMFEKTKEMTLEGLRRDVFGAHWEDRTWHEVLRLITGMIDEKFAGEVIDFLVNSVGGHDVDEQEKHLPWNIALAVQCLTELRNYKSIEAVASQLLQVCCKLFESLKVHDSYGLAAFLDAEIAPSAQSVGSSWPGKEQIPVWLVSNFIPGLLSFTGYKRNHSCGIFVGSVGTDCPEMEEPLLSLMKHLDGGVQCFVAHALSEYRRGEAKNGELLLHFIRNGSYSVARGFAAGYLVENCSPEPSSIALLYELAVSDPDEFTRTAMLEVLATHFSDDERTLPLLLDRAVNDESPEADSPHVAEDEVRIAALNLITTYWPDDPRTLPLLHERIQNDPTPQVRARAQSLAAKLEGDEDEANA